MTDVPLHFAVTVTEPRNGSHPPLSRSFKKSAGKDGPKALPGRAGLNAASFHLSICASSNICVGSTRAAACEATSPAVTPRACSTKVVCAVSAKMAAITGSRVSAATAGGGEAGACCGTNLVSSSARLRPAYGSTGTREGTARCPGRGSASRFLGPRGVAAAASVMLLPRPSARISTKHSLMSALSCDLPIFTRPKCSSRSDVTDQDARKVIQLVEKDASLHVVQFGLNHVQASVQITHLERERASHMKQLPW